MSGTRPPANRMTLQQFKARKVGAAKGHALLKKKRDALKSRFQQLLKEIVEAKLKVGAVMQDCAYSMAKATYAAGDIHTNILSRVKQPSVTCALGADNVAGVFLPVFKMEHDTSLDASTETLGIASGGQAIQNARQQHLDMVVTLVKLASLQTSFVTLDEEIKMTGRRVNALEYVVIPKLDDVIDYVNQEMDEQSREEFFRVKKVVEKKKQKLAKEVEEHAAAANTNTGGTRRTSKTSKGFVESVIQSAVDSAVREDDLDVVF